MSCCFRTIPCLLVTSIAVDSATGIATLTVSPGLPTSGRFDLRVGCNVCINPCSTAQVQLTDGTTTITNVLAKCGNFLLLGQIAEQVRRRYPIHMNATFNPTGNAICLDKLLPPANTSAITNCGTNVTVTTATTTTVVTPTVEAPSVAAPSVAALTAVKADMSDCPFKN